MRSDKFKFIMDAMASHAIEEQNTEYSASFISQIGDGRNRQNSNATAHNAQKQMKTVDEDDEESMNSTMRLGAGGAKSTHSRHQQRMMIVQQEMQMDP